MKKVYRILASLITIIFYWVIFPLTPPDKLITTGIYAKSRNPIFFRYTVILIGMGISLCSISILIIFVPAFIVFEFVWIKLEEKTGCIPI